MILPIKMAFKALGPAIPSGSISEAIRAGLGAFLGLGIVGLFLLLISVDFHLGLYLIAPFGATSVLIFAVPSSPLAQPWSAIVGNTVSAFAAIIVCYYITEPALCVALAVGLAITVMILLRALHPPGGAVAMTAALNPEAIREAGFWFALSPVAFGTVLLVLVAVIYASVSDRRYPFRQFEEKNTHGTTDHEPAERLGLSEEELTDILTQYRQSLNLGVEDLSRLIAAAELQAAGHRTGPLTVSDIMSRDLVTVGPDTALHEVADLFRRHGFTSLPVVEDDDRFLGVIFQLHLIRKAGEDAFGANSGLGTAMTQFLRPERGVAARAGEIMDVTGPRAVPDKPISALLPQMADGSCDAVPVLDHDRIVGIVTRTDLIAALARQSLRHSQD